MIETLRNCLREKRAALPEVPYDVVRAVTCRINEPDVALKGLIPTIGDLPVSKEGTLPILQFSFSSVLWLLKGEGSAFRDEVQLLGGRMVAGRDKTKEHALARELAEESHLFGYNVKGNPENPASLVQIGERNYSFRHPRDKKNRRCYHELLFRAEASPSLSPFSPDPSTHARTILTLSPVDIETLFENDSIDIEGQRVKLVDSLSLHSERWKRAKSVMNMDELIAARQQILYEAYLYEAKIRSAVIDRLLAITSNRSQKQLQTIWSRLKPRGERYPSTLADIKQFIGKTHAFLQEFETTLSGADIDVSEASDVLPENTLAYLNQQGIKKATLGKRIKLLRELNLAIVCLRFEHSLPFFSQSGEQKPFLVAQLLFSSDRLFAYEYPAIKENCPEVANLIDTACEAFDIKPLENPHWYEDLTADLERYRDEKVKVDHGTASEEEALDYSTKSDLLELTFAQKFGIDPDDLSEFAAYATEFLNFLAPALRKIVDPVILRYLFPDNQKTGTSAIDELLLQFFGIDQNDRINDASVTPEQRWAVARRLLLIAFVKDVHARWKEQTKPFTYTFRGIFDSFVIHISLDEPMSVAPEMAFHRYRFRTPPVERIETNYNGKDYSIDTSAIDACILSDIRGKNLYSFIRKVLERGSVISDFNGRKIVLDLETFQEDVKRLYPFLTWHPDLLNHISQEWAKKVTAHIIQYYKDRLTSFGYLYTTKNVRESPALAHILQEAGVTVEDEVHLSSAASKATWEWLKFVHTAKREKDGKTQLCQEEMQIFPSVKDLEVKLGDDAERFSLERLFLPHLEGGRFPLMTVLFGIQNVYEALTRAKYRDGDLFWGGSGIFRGGIHL